MGIYCVLIFITLFLYLSVKSSFVNPPLQKKFVPLTASSIRILWRNLKYYYNFFCIYLLLNSIFIFICFVFAQRPEQSIWWYWYKNWHVPSSYHNSSCGFYNGFCVWLEAYSCHHCHQSIVDDRGWYYGKGMFFSMQWCMLPLRVPA